MRRVGPFVTHVTYLRPDGGRVEWGSRHHRKHRSRLSRPAAGEGVWWAPRRASWWIGVLFAIGSACFLVGPLPGVVQAVGPGADGVIFFVGSIFFTSAAALQYLEAVNADRDLEGGGPPTGLRVLGWELRRIDVWASLIQLAGTVLFNVDTFDAMQTGLSVHQENRLIFAPDLVGSACFLVASWLAYAEVCGRVWCRPRRELAWWIGALNLIGSVAFGVSAIASYFVPATGDELDFAVANGFTALGAACFLAGAVLLLPEGAERPLAPPAGCAGAA